MLEVQWCCMVQVSRSAVVNMVVESAMVIEVC